MELKEQLELIYHNAFENGYLSESKLTDNDRYIFYKFKEDIFYKVQVNHARSKYSDALLDQKGKKTALAKGAQCLICHENSQQKHNLETVNLTLKDHKYFIQLTPFPLYPKHFVVVDRAHQPMEVSPKRLSHLLSLLEQLPDYTVVSNSDRFNAGASILSHHHFQMIHKTDFPIFTAKERMHQSFENIQMSCLNFPIFALKLRTMEPERLTEMMGGLLDYWRGKDDENTFNIIARKNNGYFECYLIFRNPQFLTQPKELIYKSEGVGVIEVCGEGVFPTPTTRDLMGEIQKDGGEILHRIISSLNPIREDFADQFEEMISSLHLNMV
ncbi:DUF4922 domain-containing protein [Persicobacter psychrovividus]|uniref:DUF4922 domain-containing protein n=1 Tax=Persicobacter psychrovividus TaxID=387638 RepID=A0ABM7VMH4_9BACT|nr:hypothetical protein PEPS_44520 [Persicobacter psychrovividus]